MRFLHSMIRINDLEKSLDFFVNKLGLKQVKRNDYEKGQFSLIFLESEGSDAQVELTYNWDNKEDYSDGRNFGHLAFQVENIYETCQKLQESDVTILRPPRDGKMAFVKSPDGISIELLQKGEALTAKEPWLSQKNSGAW